MVDDLATAREEVRRRLLDADALVSASAGGALRGESPRWRRVELRPVDLKEGPRLQIATFDERQSFTRNQEWDAADEAVAELLADSGPATPAIAPLPKSCGRFDRRRSTE